MSTQSLCVPHLACLGARLVAVCGSMAGSVCTLRSGRLKAGKGVQMRPDVACTRRHMQSLKLL